LPALRYYNDSKATNVDATLKALDAFPGRILYYSRRQRQGQLLTPLQSRCEKKRSSALLIGSAAPKIESQITGSVAIDRAEHSNAPWRSLRTRHDRATWSC